MYLLENFRNFLSKSVYWFTRTRLKVNSVLDREPKHISNHINPIKSFKIYPNLSKSIQIYPNLSKSIQIYPNQSKSIQIYPNLSKTIKLSKPLKLCNS